VGAVITIVPVGTAQVGCTVTLAVGVAGGDGWALITIFPDDTEIHPETPSVTVYVYVVPAASPFIVVLVPEPVVIVPPGVRVNVQVPDDGSPFNTTLPVATAHVG